LASRIVAYVAEGQAELCEFPVGGLHLEILKFMPMGFQPELKREFASSLAKVRVGRSNRLARSNKIKGL